MKFITKRNGKTGKKFSEIEKQKNVCHKEQCKLSKEMGFVEWRNAYWAVWGGVSSVIFKDENKVDKKLWKNVEGHSDEWMPRRNSKEGKLLHGKLISLSKVSIDDLNECIGFDGAPFKTIGFAFNSKTYFGFEVEEKWDVKIPKDCKEVTTTKYNSLFKES